MQEESISQWLAALFLLELVILQLLLLFLKYFCGRADL